MCMYTCTFVANACHTHIVHVAYMVKIACSAYKWGFVGILWEWLPS